MEWRDPNTGQIKIWVWAVAGIGFVVLLFLITKVVGGGQTTAGGTIPAGGQSSDITDLISQLNDSLAGLNDTTEPTPNPSPNPNPDPTAKTKQYTVKASDTWRTIAAKFGMTLDQFFTLNPKLKNVGTPDTSRTGGRIVSVFDVPEKTATPTRFTLTKRLDTWTEVMNRFHLTREQFFALNPNLDTKREKNVNLERKAGREVIVGTSYT